MPLLCLAGLAFAKLCYSFALPLRSGRIRRSAKLSTAPHFRSRANLGYAMPRRRRSTRCLCYALLCLRISAPCHGRSVLCDSLAGLSYALAQLICAVLCLCDSELCYALASPLTSFPCLCATDPCSASAMLPNAMPPPGRSFHSHALAVPVYAFPSPCYAFAALRLTAPSHGFAGLRFSIALASFASHFRRVTDLCAAIAARRLPMPCPCQS